MGQLIYEQIPKVAKSIGAIGKDKKNIQQGFMFRGIDSVYNACHGPMVEHGVFCTTEVSDVEREERTTPKGGVLFYTRLKLKVTFYAADGSSVVTVTAGEAMDSGDKATNKAMSAALKYAFFQTFTIPVDEMDDADKTTHEVAPREQPQPKPQPEMTPEQSEFNAWVQPHIKAGRLGQETVRATLAANGKNYKATREALELLDSMQPAV